MKNTASYLSACLLAAGLSLSASELLPVMVLFFAMRLTILHKWRTYMDYVQ